MSMECNQQILYSKDFRSRYETQRMPSVSLTFPLDWDCDAFDHLRRGSELVSAHVLREQEILDLHSDETIIASRRKNVGVLRIPSNTVNRSRMPLQFLNQVSVLPLPDIY